MFLLKGPLAPPGHPGTQASLGCDLSLAPKWSAPCGLGAEAKRAHRAQRTGAGVLLRTRATAARSTRQLRSEHAQDGVGGGRGPCPSKRIPVRSAPPGGMPG